MERPRAYRRIDRRHAGAGDHAQRAGAERLGLAAPGCDGSRRLRQQHARAHFWRRHRRDDHWREHRLAGGDVPFSGPGDRRMGVTAAVCGADLHHGLYLYRLLSIRRALSDDLA